MTQNEIYAVLRRSPLFEGMTDGEINRELQIYDVLPRSYVKGETVLSLGKPVLRFGIILSGSVQVMRDDINGQHMIMATVQAGQTFAESLCFRQETEAPVYALALGACDIYWLDASRFRRGPEARFLSILTEKTLSMNDRIQVLSKLTIRDKLNALFSLYAQSRGSEFVLPFDRESLAAYLGTNRSALSREMSRMKREGLIEYSGSRIRLLETINE